MSYQSNKKLVEDLIDYISTKVEKRTALPDKIRKYLKEKANVWIYTEMPPAIKKKYDEYLINFRTKNNTVNDFRGLCFGNQYIRSKKMSKNEKYSKTDIVLHNTDETRESLAWVMLHELFHSYLKHENPFEGVCSAVHSINWIWEDRIDRLNGKDGFNSEFYNTDEGHEQKPEEIMCNLYATSILGHSYDRIYWRSNLQGNKVGSYKIKKEEIHE